MGIIATGLQTRTKDCYKTSERVRLTLRTNGEEKNSIITPSGAIVLAGIDAPETAPTGSVGGGGTLSGYYVYCYVYASTQYPFVENAVTTGNGQLWPRSNPSPMSSVQDCSAGSKTVTLTATKTTQSGIDRILFYRTQTASTSAAAQALADAGELFYIAQVTNNGIAGTISTADAGLTDTGEELELDNYTSDTAEFCEFDGTYWWAAGSSEYSATVSLDGTSSVTITDGDTIFTGRDGQTATFDGISTGGFDGTGTFYVGITSTSTLVLYSDEELTTPLAVPFTGTTTIHIRGLSNILYRSKPFNPFSWGFIETTVNDAQETVETPQSFALNLGGGAVSAMAVSPNGKSLVIHFENPQRTIALDLEFADSDQFGSTTRILDNTGSVTSNFTLFNGYVGEQPMMIGLDSYNGNILASDGYRQQIVSDNLGELLTTLERSDRAPKFFHGQYDSRTELNCFWVRLYDTEERNNIMVWLHAPTGAWGWMPDFDVLSSGSCLDQTTNERLTIGGTGSGFMGRILADDVWNNWLYSSASVSLMNDTQITLPTDAPVITQTDAAGGVFRTSEIRWSVGQEVLVYYSNPNDYFSITSANILPSSEGMLPGDTKYFTEDSGGDHSYVDGDYGSVAIATVGATGTATALTISDAGTYTVEDTMSGGVWASAAGGSGASISITLQGTGPYTILSAAIAQAGTGYVVGDVFTIVGDGGTTYTTADVTVTTVNGSGGITGVSVVAGSGSYETEVVYSIYIGRSGYGANLSPTFTFLDPDYTLSGITITNGGLRYRYGDAIEVLNEFSVPAGEAVVSGVDASGTITSISITTPGSFPSASGTANVDSRTAAEAVSDSGSSTISADTTTLTILDTGIVDSITPISDTVWETTLDTAYTSSGLDLQATWHPRYMGSIVNVLYVPNSRANNCDAYYINVTFVQFDDFETFTVTVDDYMRVGNDEFITTQPYPWGADVDMFIGGIPCAWRSYFDLDTPTIDKRNDELWFTSAPADDTNGPGARFYREFIDESTTGDCFPTVRGTYIDGTFELASYNRTEVPSPLLKEFGMELIQVSAGEFTFYNLTLKSSEAA